MAGAWIWVSGCLMKGFVSCRPMSDEVAWSHAARFIWVNGWDRNPELLTCKLLGAESVPPPVPLWWRAILVESSWLPTSEYLARHTVEALIDLDASGKSNLDHIWRNLPALRSSRLRLSRAMACPECVEEDKNVYGFTWFRRSHHVQGVELCLRHNCGLCNVSSPTFAGHIGALNQGRLIASPPSEWCQNQYVQAFHARLSELFALSRPINWYQLRLRVYDMVAANRKKRGPPPWGSIFQWGVADAPPGWLKTHFRFNFRVENRLNSVFEQRLSAIDIALLLACHPPD